ncbi:hypothetical protein SELMODRAFT_426806 [Selaginella moellendorffii]|uniref:Uncharacterized protein n=1 Tax=Selaginella moellendorffii TaxID=88036 RepID=D8SXJ6_SELML|nr:hypothetical protein SELMODRAFT_426806 [Selaginella moellendorffii]
MPFVVVDAFQGVVSGVARGCGWQAFAAFANLGSYYAVGLVVAYVLPFVHMNEKGLDHWDSVWPFDASDLTAHYFCKNQLEQADEEEKTHRIQCSHRKAQVHHRIEDTTFSRWKIAEHLQRPGTILVLHLEQQVHVYRVPDSKTPDEQNPFGNVEWFRLGLVPDPVDERRLHRSIDKIKVGNLPSLQMSREPGHT